MIIEYFDTEVSQDQIADSCELAIGQAESALENARVHSEIFLQPVWKRLGWLQKLLFGDHLAKTITGLCALLLLTALMIWFPKELKMKVDGVMHPTDRKTIFSLTDGIITEVAVEERSQIRQGDILLQLENADLELQIEETKLQLDSIPHQLVEIDAQLSDNRTDDDDRMKLDGQRSLLEERRSNLEKQLELMKKKQSFLKITSPIDGTVVTSQPQRRLANYPTTANQALLEVADLRGAWQLELKIPQNKIGYVTQAMEAGQDKPLTVEFRIGTNPNLVLAGKLVNVSHRAVASAEGNIEFMAIVEADGEQFSQLGEELRTGAGVTAKIHCGTESLGFVCFYQIYDWLRTRVFF